MCFKKKSQFTDEEKKVFGKARLTTVTFSKERLPFLRNLLTRYREANEEQRRRYQHDIEMKDIFRPLTSELGQYIHRQYRDMDEKKELSWLPDDQKLLHIFCAYAGSLLHDLQKLRDKGWDGKSLQHDDYADRYRSDAVSRLEALVWGLEAGYSQVTLEIPSDLAGEYETWFISAIEWAIREGKGPASGEK